MDVSGNPERRPLCGFGFECPEQSVSPTEDIAAFEASLTEEERECRLHGVPLNLAGLIYKGYNKAKHLRLEPLEGWSDFL